MKRDFVRYFSTNQNFSIKFYQHVYFSPGKRLTLKNNVKTLQGHDQTLRFFIFPHFCRLKGFLIFKTIEYCFSSHHWIGPLL